MSDNEKLGKCKNPFTGAEDCDVRVSGKSGKAYLVTPWGPFSSKSPGFDAHCRSIVKPAGPATVTDQAEILGPASEEKPVAAPATPEKKLGVKGSFLSEFLP